MTKKQLVLIFIALVGLGAYVHYFTDWFTPATIQIVHTLRAPMTGRRSPNPSDKSDVNTVSFALNAKFKLTEVKVMAVSDMATNKYPHAVWHLITESNSIPTKSLVYGMPVPGMHPKIAGVRAEPLEPGVSYQLMITAGEVKGEHEFKTSPIAVAPR